MNMTQDEKCPGGQSCANPCAGTEEGSEMYVSVFEKGFKEGFKEGFEEGLREGRQEVRVEVAKSLLNDGVPVEKIVQYTDLTREEIETLQ
jgi:predicted transposase/invertase (TIGR01784 family)